MNDKNTTSSELWNDILDDSLSSLPTLHHGEWNPLSISLPSSTSLSLPKMSLISSSLIGAPAASASSLASSMSNPMNPNTNNGTGIDHQPPYETSQSMPLPSSPLSHLEPTTPMMTITTRLTGYPATRMSSCAICFSHKTRCNGQRPCDR
jgi:hypothetical protein